MWVSAESPERHRPPGNQPPRRLHWERPPAGGLCLHLGPLAPGMADTLGVLVREGLRRSALREPDLYDACQLRAALVRPDRGASGTAGFETLELQFDAQDAWALARALAVSQLRQIGELDTIHADEVPCLVDPVPVGPLSRPYSQDPREECLGYGLDMLNLRPRTREALTRAGLSGVGQLLPLSPSALLRLPLLGRRGLEEIQVGLAALGVCLAPDSPPFRP